MRIIHHNRNDNASFRNRFFIEHPHAAYFTDSVIEWDMPFSWSSDLPAKAFFVKRRWCVDIRGGHFQVTNFPISTGWLFVFHLSVFESRIKLTETHWLSVQEYPRGRILKRPRIVLDYLWSVIFSSLERICWATLFDSDLRWYCSGAFCGNAFK